MAVFRRTFGICQVSATVLFLAFDGIIPLDLTGPMQVFATANGRAVATGRAPPYRLRFASATGGRVRTSAGLEILCEPLAEVPLDEVHTLVAPGGVGLEAGGPRDLVDWLRRHGPGIPRVCSVCTGAFLLAESGILDGRRATTHWRSVPEFQRRYPRVRVDFGPIFVRDGDLWTSAGVSAGIDLALHILEADQGRSAAMEVAKTLVVFFRRPGGQQQFSMPMELQSRSDRGFSALIDWVAGNLGADLSVPVLANRMAMSQRTFARRFQAAFGDTPRRVVDGLRVEAAKRLLEDEAVPLKRIAAACGFADEQALRRVFLRRTGTNPTDYRRHLT